jgi:hypothetical protein
MKRPIRGMGLKSSECVINGVLFPIPPNPLLLMRFPF